METLRLIVDAAVPANTASSAASTSLIAQAAAILRSGGTVAMPTETVYGLAANALDPAAIAAIFAAKDRPHWDPLIVHVADEAMLRQVAAEISDRAHALIRTFWPGPLTLLLPRSLLIPDAVTAGRPLVGVRMPRHPVALALIQAAGVPLAAPSANRFGHTSPTTADHVLADLAGRIDAVLDAGPTACGLESTVLDPTCSPMVVYRPGAVTLEQIVAVAGPAVRFREIHELTASPRAALPSPGVGLRHYAPRARLVLFDPADALAALPVISTLESHLRIGLMQPAGLALPNALRADNILRYPWGSWQDTNSLAQHLFAGLRWLDQQSVDLILCPLPPTEGIGQAIHDRLRKAASSAPFDDEPG